MLFTSGSEGAAEGRRAQPSQHPGQPSTSSPRVIDFNPTDIVFNALPLFHSFGLTRRCLLPLLSGVRSFLYPSPLHYRIVPELAYDTNATIMFGTDTFLAGYARMAHPYDFYSVRYVFAGAERVKAETRASGPRSSACASSKATARPRRPRPRDQHADALPRRHGRTVPARHRLQAGAGAGHRAWRAAVVSGPNVMLGYLRAEKPGVLEPVADGWYDTGDIVDIDETGFVTIAGRAKRFAKIAGEMVSLTLVENIAIRAWPDHQHAAVSIEDDRKGEQVILITDDPDADREALLRKAQELGLSEIMVPRTIMITDAIPLLGTGKVDYVAARALALTSAGKTGVVKRESRA